MVRKVGIHLHEDVELGMLLKPGKPVPTGQTAATRRFPAHEVNPWLMFRQAANHLPGTIGGLVNDHKNLKTGVQSQQVGNQGLDVPCLIIGGKHGQDFAAAESGYHFFNPLWIAEKTSITEMFRMQISPTGHFFR